MSEKRKADILCDATRKRLNVERKDTTVQSFLTWASLSGIRLNEKVQESCYYSLLE